MRSPARRPSATSSACERGLTLVELLVAMAVGLMVMLSVLTVQIGASNQNLRVNDINQRDNEVRAALDMLTQDVASAGYLLTPGVPNCAARLNYDSGAPSPGYFASWQVQAFAASSGQTMPFATAGALTMDYPPTGSGNRSDVLVISRAADSTQYGDPATPTTLARVNASFHPTTSGQLPVAATSRLTAGHIGLVLAPVGGQLACLRVPITSLGSSSGSSYLASSGTLMPAGYYGGFSSNLGTIGMTAGSLSDAGLMLGKVMDLGTATTSNQLTYVYYVSSTAFAWPTLMRAQVNPLNDTVTTVQPIAAGVVSLQVLFGVDTTGSGSVTAYETGATVASSNQYANIRSVRIGLIARSLYADPGFASPATISIPGTSTSVPFTAFTVSAANNRHTAQVTEVALRNTLWTP